MPSHAPDFAPEEDGEPLRLNTPPADVPVAPMEVAPMEIGYESAHPALTGLVPGDQQGAASVWC